MNVKLIIELNFKKARCYKNEKENETFQLKRVLIIEYI